MLLALKTEEGVASRNWKGMGHGFSPRACRRDRSPVTLGFSPVQPMLDL